MKINEIDKVREIREGVLELEKKESIKGVELGLCFKTAKDNLDSLERALYRISELLGER